MISLQEAFAKFKSRLELTDTEQKDTSRRHLDVRALIREEFDVETDFLSGSYGRRTKTKPLKDVDIFVVLGKDEEYRLEEPSANLLEDVRKVLAGTYGKDAVKVARRSVGINFGIKEDESEGKVMSIDVVPAFHAGPKAYKIPDPESKEKWTKTDPEVHAEKATKANKAMSGEWVPLVKMLKKWNNVHDKPIKPSFLIEVMALDILYPPFSGGYVYELKSFFATASMRIDETWADPAGLGQPVSDRMDLSMRKIAREKLSDAERQISLAVQLTKQGKNGEALRIWRERVFGHMFPLS